METGVGLLVLAAVFGVAFWLGLKSGSATLHVGIHPERDSNPGGFWGIQLLLASLGLTALSFGGAILLGWVGH